MRDASSQRFHFIWARSINESWSAPPRGLPERGFSLVDMRTEIDGCLQHKQHEQCTGRHTDEKNYPSTQNQREVHPQDAVVWRRHQAADRRGFVFAPPDEVRVKRNAVADEEPRY